MGTDTNIPPRRERNGGNSNKPSRPVNREIGTNTNRPPRRERGGVSDDNFTRPVASGNSKKLQVLRQKVHAYKIILISVLVLYVVTVFGGIGLATNGSLEADKYKKELDSVESELDGYKTDYENSTADVRELCSTIESKDAEIEEYKGELEDYKSQIEEYKGKIASLKETNKEYKKKVKKYKAIINATPTPSPTPTPTPVPDVPLEYKNALEKAESYSKHLHMSKQEIYEQLISEYGNSFPPDAAQYAVDTLFG